MKMFKYIVVGFFFGFGMWKLEAISTFRIFEMFHFQSFHMYGIIGSAVILGVILVALIKRSELKSTEGSIINFNPKNMSISRYLIGGTIFGLGWALTGACPGPIYVLLGNGFFVYLVVLFMAILGTLTYGLLRDKLPH